MIRNSVLHWALALKNNLLNQPYGEKMLFQLEYVSPHGRLDHGGKLENIYMLVRLIDHTMIDVLKNFFLNGMLWTGKIL